MASAALPGEDWRLSVPQSFRNAEVREIARVLASLEPGASAASKLRLAMQFEDSVFKQASSLADYRKRLTKRLKKVQKSYVPTATAAQAPSVSASAPISHKEQALLELKSKYGDTLRYILKHADKAIVEMRGKHGAEVANQLKQHIDGARIWATDLGLVESSSSGQAPALNLHMSDSQLDQLRGHLEKRIENIRAHVVKLADPDLFMKETTEKIEKELIEKPRAAKVLAECLRRRYEQLNKASLAQAESSAVDMEAMVKQNLEESQKIVPLPTRSQKNDEQAALIHLEKMRAAAHVMMAYMGVRDKYALPRNCLPKVHAVATEGMAFVQTVMRNYRKNNVEASIKLEDAWMKPLILSTHSEDPFDTSPEKRIKLSRPAMVMRSKVLLTTGRKTPSSLMSALKRKRAILVRPPPLGEGSHLILEFGEAFVMTIYFVPLVVTLRAYTKKEAGWDSSYSGERCATWTPVHGGLSQREQLSVWGAKGTFETLGFVVKERLRDASSHATFILRKIFAGGAAKETAADFEQEILEATALLEFLQLARTTYMPNWQDDDL